MVPVGVGKHHRCERAPEWTLDPGLTWPQWDAPPPELHPDHPSAPLPQVRQQAPAASPPWSHAYLVGPGFEPAQDYHTGPGYQPSRGYHRRVARPAAQDYATSPGYEVVRGSGPPVRFYAGRHAAGRVGQRLYDVPGEALDDPAEFDDEDDEYVARLTGYSGRWGWLPPDSDERQSQWLPTSGSWLPTPGSAADGEAVIRVDAWDEVAAIRQAAEQDAATIRQRGIEQAAAIYRAAEQESAQLRSQVLAMSADLKHLATYVTRYLGKQALWRQRTEPWQGTAAFAAEGFAAEGFAAQNKIFTPVRVVIRPRAAAVVGPALMPLPERPRRAGPSTRPRPMPGTKPVRRQAAAIRKMVIVFTTLVGVTWQQD